MDDVLVRSRDGWESETAGSRGGISWTTLHETDDVGVLRYGGEAPPGATVAWIRYEDAEHRVPVRHSHLLFVAWNTAGHEDPQLLRFD